MAWGFECDQRKPDVSLWNLGSRKPKNMWVPIMPKIPNQRFKARKVLGSNQKLYQSFDEPFFSSHPICFAAAVSLKPKSPRSYQQPKLSTGTARIHMLFAKSQFESLVISEMGVQTAADLMCSFNLSTLGTYVQVWQFQIMIVSAWISALNQSEAASKWHNFDYQCDILF